MKKYYYFKDENSIKVASINDVIYMKRNCDWIEERVKELKILFAYKSENQVRMYKTRALLNIEAIEASLRELKPYIESL